MKKSPSPKKIGTAPALDFSRDASALQNGGAAGEMVMSGLAAARAASGRAEADAFALFEKAMLVMSPAQIAARIGLHANTVIRWLERREAPRHYRMDFLRILGKPVVSALPEGNAEKELDQFFTKRLVARRCFGVFERTARGLGLDLSRRWHIEPSAGEGCFTDLLPERRRIALDIAPRRADIQRADFLTWTPPAGRKYAVVGNPPFGLRGHAALQFVNRAADFADIIGFILPQLFESDGKGAPMKRVDKRLALAHSERLPPNSFAHPDGTPTSISTVFQVWTKVNHGRIVREPAATCDSFVRVYSLSDGGTPSSTRNKAMIGKCDAYLPSTCYGGMRAYRAFSELPNARGYGVVILKKRREIAKLLFAHDWERTAFPSTNSALNLRGSLIKRAVIDGGFRDA